MLRRSRTAGFGKIGRYLNRCAMAAGPQDAGQLTALFDTARLRLLELAHPSTRDDTTRSLIASIAVGPGNMRISINLVALGSIGEAPHELPLPERKPFRETKLRIDPTAVTDQIDRKLVSLIAEAIGCTGAGAGLA